MLVISREVKVSITISRHEIIQCSLMAVIFARCNQGSLVVSIGHSRNDILTYLMQCISNNILLA